MRMVCGSARGPAALTPQDPATLALSQQQRQQAACLASMMHNLHAGVAQIHYSNFSGDYLYALLHFHDSMTSHQLATDLMLMLILDKDGAQSINSEVFV